MKHLDLKRDKVICVGDSYNDLSMIQYAGKGVAMGNGQPEVKEAADYVAPSNDEDGIVEIIKKFMTPAKSEETKEEEKEKETVLEESEETNSQEEEKTEE